jgi:hypothetical protein
MATVLVIIIFLLALNKLFGSKAAGASFFPSRIIPA